jgi:hypothetical protein
VTEPASPEIKVARSGSYTTTWDVIAAQPGHSAKKLQLGVAPPDQRRYLPASPQPNGAFSTKGAWSGATHERA